jgi:HlyD family secretion protein
MRRLLLPLLLVACHRGSEVPPGYQGLVEYDDRVIGFEVAGRVSEVAVHRGQSVKPQDILARLDRSVAAASRDARQAELEAARADLALLKAGARAEDVAAAAEDVRAATADEALARKEADRSRSLVASGAITRAESDRSEATLQRATARRASLQARVQLLRHGARPEELARAQAAVEQRTAALAAETEQLARYDLRATSAGTILDVTVKQGEVAAPGTPAVLLADVEHPYADVFVPENQLGTLQVGTRAEARVDAVPHPFAATVEYVSPETEFTPRFLFSDTERPHLVIRVRVRVDDRNHELHAGVPVFVQVAR